MVLLEIALVRIQHFTLAWWRTLISLTQRCSLDFLPRCRTSEKGVLKTTCTFIITSLFPREQEPRANLQSRPDIDTFIHSSALLWIFISISPKLYSQKSYNKPTFSIFPEMLHSSSECSLSPCKGPGHLCQATEGGLKLIGLRELIFNFCYSRLFCLLVSPFLRNTQIMIHPLGISEQNYKNCNLILL